MSTPAFLQGILGHDRGLFCKVVGAVPEDGRGYRPDPKARSAEAIIEHLIGHNQDLIELLDDGVIHHRQQVPFETIDDAVATLDQTFGEVIERLGNTDEETWMSPAKFLAGPHVIMEAPRMQLARVLFLDAVHHRGQLSTYLRPMGSKVPAIYGPSADDQGEGH
jgi:uncharacterized damage-inducible protein DinB